MHLGSAVSIGQASHMLDAEQKQWSFTSQGIRIVCTEDFQNLQTWQGAMKEKVDQLNKNIEEERDDTSYEEGDVTNVNDMEAESLTTGRVETMETTNLQEESLESLDTSDLLWDQRCVYNIVDWHLKETLGTFVKAKERIEY